MRMIISVDIVISIILLAFGYYASCYYLHNKKLLSKSFDVLKLTRNKIVYLCLGTVASFVLILLFQVLYHTEFITQIKLLVLVLIILPTAAVDYKTHKIPNKFMLFALILRCLIYVVELIVSKSSALLVLKDSVVGALVVGVFFFLLLLIFKNSIGMGDVKLFAIMGLYQGLWGVVNSVFFSLVASFVISIFLLATKKKNKKDVISFAPSIFIGTVIAICLSGI